MTGGVTPVYAAPETFDGWVSRYSDQYSLGIVYQELLTGERPFAGNNVRNLILLHLEADPDVSPLPKRDQPIIHRALSKKPDARYPSCLELVEALIEASPEDRPNHSSATVISPSEGVESEALSALTLPTPLAKSNEPITETPPPTPSSKLHIPRPTVARNAAKTATQGQLRPSTSGLRSGPPIEPDGSLAPSLIIGLGGFGIKVLAQIAEDIRDRFGSLEALPLIRLLGIDTNPEILKEYQAASSEDQRGFSANNIMVLGLQRPSYYFKPVDGKPNVADWLSQEMLYRIPRNLRPSGARAFGRLALVDNYRSVKKRLIAELDACTDRTGLEQALLSTRMQLWTEQPRVYLVSSSCGGSGSGMIFDLGYLLKHILKKRSCPESTVTAALLTPGMESARDSRLGSSQNSSKSSPLALGNTCATLTELHYYSSSKSQFLANYSKQDAPVYDEGKPFEHCYLLPLPPEGKKEETKESIQLVSELLSRQVVTALGRALHRNPTESTEDPVTGPTFQTFGIFRLLFPRIQIVKRVANRLCERMLERWMTKDPSQARPAVTDFLENQWKYSKDLTAENFIETLQSKSESILGKEAEAALNSALLPLIRKQAGSSDAATGRRAHELTTAHMETEDILQVIRAVEQLVGKPEASSGEQPGLLERAIQEASESISVRWGQKLAELPVKLIERPAFRLAGAEESIRQIVQRIEHLLQSQEPLCNELTQKATTAHSRIRSFLAQLRAEKARPQGQGLLLSDLIELLRCYGKWRYQSLILGQVTRTFISLRGHLNDELREIGFCRARLGELREHFAVEPNAVCESPSSRAQGSSASSKQAWYSKQNNPAKLPDIAYGRFLFPQGCENLAQATSQVLEALSPEDLEELEDRIQRMIRKQFRALVEVCLGTKHVTKNVEVALRRVTESFLEEWLHDNDVAELLVSQSPDGDGLKEEVRNAFEEAMPEPISRMASEPTERAILSIPGSASGDYLQTMISHSIPSVEYAGPATDNEILIYREWSQLPLTELEQLGATGQEAYRALLQLENFTPHSRMDIPFEVPVELSEW